jgi:HAD superfamily hydrolase (TIGR01662 family)
VASRLRGVIFDFGGTIVSTKLDWPFVHAESRMRLGAFLCDFLGEGRAWHVVEGFLKNRERHKVECERTMREKRSDEMLASALREVGVVFPREKLIQAVDAFFEGEVSRFELFPGVRDVLTTLGKRGLRIGIVSNNTWHKLVVDTLKRHGIDDAFDPIVLSSEATVRKPDPAIWNFVLDAWDTGPEEVVMIGDSSPADVEGAKATGMRAIWCRFEADEKTDHEAVNHHADAVVTSFDQIPSVIESLDTA